MALQSALKQEVAVMEANLVHRYIILAEMMR